MGRGGDNTDIHATGQPDTPVEVLTDLLRNALQSRSLEEVHRSVQQALSIASELDGYLERISTPPSDVIKKMVAASLAHDWTGVYKQGKTIFHQKKECCAGTLEGCFIKMICQLVQAKTVLEVGMFTGTTTVAMAQAVPDDGKVVALEIEPYMKEFAEPYFQEAGVADRIEVMVGSASESIDKLAKRGSRFDIAFLDADKGGYLGYYNKLMEHNLIVPGGIIVVDNALMKARVYAADGVKDDAAEAIRKFNEVVRQDPRVEVVCIPIRDGVSLVRRRPPAPEQGDEVLRGCQRNNILQRFKLNNQVALVTGGGQGIGRAFAHALGEAGAAVAVVDINLATAEKVAEELNGKGIRAVAIQADVRKLQDAQKMVDETVERLGGLHIAINNAGVNKNAAAEDTSPEDWDLTFDINTKGVFLGCQAQGRYMFKQGYGKIINTASMSTLLVPHPQKQIAYNASKAAVVKITKTLAAEWADRGVRVNCISPGIVRTPLIEESEALRPLVGEWLSQIPAGKLAEVMDLQAAIVYLACGASDYMTGHNLVVEGGQSLW